MNQELIELRDSWFAHIAKVNEDLRGSLVDHIAKVGQELGTEIASARENIANVRENIANVREDVANLTEDVANLTEDVAKVKQDVARVTGDVAKVKQDVAELTRDVAELTRDVAKGRQALLEQIRQGDQQSRETLAAHIADIGGTSIRKCRAWKSESLLNLKESTHEPTGKARCWFPVAAGRRA